jgi:hypothetical protein
MRKPWTGRSLASEAERWVIEALRAIPGHTLPSWGVHKAVYELREGGLVKPDAVPYYWYKHGPYSEVLDSAIKLLVAKGDLQTTAVEGGRTVTLQPRLIEPPSRDVEPILVGFSRYNTNQRNRSIYLDHAPTDFQPAYRLDYLDALTDWSKIGHRSAIESGPGSLARAQRALQKAETVWPDDTPYEQVLPAFIDYVSIMSSYTGDPELAAGHANTLLDDGKAMWNTFAQALRIAAHDPFYDDQLDAWERALHHHVDELTRINRERWNDPTLVPHVKVPTSGDARMLSYLLDDQVKE